MTPTKPWTLLFKVYREIIPQAHQYLEEWKERAKQIPDEELRNQALMSIDTKSFHCEGGAIYGLIAQDKQAEIIRFIVAYQTISDYLDNLCDRSTSIDPEDFRALHEAMLHALNPEMKPINYYRYRVEQEDGGYLHSLVTTCQEVLQTLPSYFHIKENINQLCCYYTDLQVYKHVKKEEREHLLIKWYEQHKHDLPSMSWYEFSACAGSTLGIFCLAAYSTKENLSVETVNQLYRGYFPWVQGIHILLDYFIDQEEDRLGGDLNFCFYYESEEKMIERFQLFVKEANESIRDLPDSGFHRLINKGLLAIYIADEKVQKQKDVKRTAKKFIKLGGLPTIFFYLNSWIYRRQ